jgi:UDP-2,3-diacylglucosamine hydrolase
MIEAVFISDLHLEPARDDITERFTRFIRWAADHTKQVYILGDFFHAWPGDDALDDWSLAIAKQLSWLASQGVALYFMHGNRDFLLGKRFMQLARLTLLNEPTIITLDGMRVLLMHGDSYCTNDINHQRLRKLTRNPFFPRLFLKLPYKTRMNLVRSLRNRSQKNRHEYSASMDIVAAVMLKHMKQQGVTTLIHGHTHKPGLTRHHYDGADYRQYILSDWDDNPLVMCYDNSKGFYFEPLPGVI